MIWFYVEYKKLVEMNLFIKQKWSHRCGKQTYGYQERKGKGINWEIGTDIYTLLYIKQIRTCYCSAGILLKTLKSTIREKNLRNRYMYTVHRKLIHFYKIKSEKTPPENPRCRQKL